MTKSASSSQPGLASRLSSGLGLDSAALRRAPDVLCALVALSLPWSTTFVAIFIVVWLLSLIPTFDVAEFIQSLKRPVSALPVILFVLAVLGTLWANDISWTARLRGIAPVAKLLLIPFFIYHFEKSGRGLWIAVAFLVSCTLVMLASWAQFADPRLVFGHTHSIGVPVKNYIAQSQEFALCVFAAIGAAAYLLRQNGNRNVAALLIGLAIVFLANMIFVVSSRTVFICIPVLLALFAFQHFSRRNAVLFVAAGVGVAIAAWMTSPYLRERTSNVVSEYRDYRERNAITSTGQRLEYWHKSIKFIAEAPIVGHGTGATKELFERDAVGQTGVSAEVIGNPHNQTLNVAIQWGALGVIALYAMWFAHFRIFAGVSGLAAWIGMVAVVENVVSSLFNSHLFDFTEGWIYVLAVGVAGGMTLHARAMSPTERPS